jgi:predicted transposase YbfD/YdcC
VDLSVISKSLNVRPIAAHERDRWISLCNEHHYLGFKGSFGYSMLYCACIGEEWIALLSWGSCALKLKSRDDWIGWSPELREVRSNLVVNNNRFVILPSHQNIQNLASTILARNVNRLSQDWYVRYHCSPVLAESFVDPNRFTGTSYLAAGWEHIGFSKGFRRVPGGFEANDQPKMIFIKPLRDDAVEVLRNPIHIDAMGKRTYLFDAFSLPIEGKDSLIDVLKKISDPRSRLGRQHSFISILGISACAMLSGARSFKAIEEWSKKLSATQLSKLRCRKRTPPSLTTIKETLYRVDAEKFDTEVNNWLSRQAQKNSRAKAIAIDGKVLRGSDDRRKDKTGVHLLSALLHDEKIIVAQRSVGEKTNEIPEVIPLLKPLEIKGVFVTFDAMHCQKKTMEYIANEKKAFYVVTVKDNQKTLLERIEIIFEMFGDQLSSICTETNRGHGRIDTRTVSCMEVSEKDFDDLGFNTIRQICKIERGCDDLTKKPLRSEIAYVVTNASRSSATSADLLSIIRNHWTIENSSHYVRDVTLQEDGSQIRSGAAPQVMATMRNLSIGIMRLGGKSNIAEGLRDTAWGKKSEALRAIGLS